LKDISTPSAGFADPLPQFDRPRSINVVTVIKEGVAQRLLNSDLAYHLSRPVAAASERFLVCVEG
jgi:hypothetical protein